MDAGRIWKKESRTQGPEINRRRSKGPWPQTKIDRKTGLVNNRQRYTSMTRGRGKFLAVLADKKNKCSKETRREWVRSTTMLEEKKKYYEREMSEEYNPFCRVNSLQTANKT